MKRMHDTNRLTELFVDTGFIAALATAMLLPGTIGANGAESTTQARPPLVLADRSATTVKLPPIPNLDAVPWLARERTPKGPRIDTLLTPLPASLQAAVSAQNRLPMWSDGPLASANSARNG